MNRTIRANRIVINEELVNAIRALKSDPSRDVIIKKSTDAISFLTDAGASAKDAAITGLVLAQSGIYPFLIKENLSEVEITNILINICERCGLTSVSAQYYLNAILKGFGFHVRIEETSGKNVVVKSKESGISYDLTGKRYAEFLDKTEKAINNGDDAFFANNENSVMLNRIVAEKNPVAMFLYGRCLYEGVGVKANSEAALKFVSSAAAAGLAAANAYLGDLYYEAGRLSKAYEHYTSPGAVALSKNRKMNLSVLLNFEKLNKKMFIRTLILSVFNIVYFLIMASGNFNPSGFASGRTIVFSVLGIILTVVLTLLLFVYHKFFKQDSVGWVTVALVFISAIITLLCII